VARSSAEGPRTPKEPAKAKMNQWLRFSSAYETSIAVTATSPKIVNGFIQLPESVSQEGSGHRRNGYSSMISLLL
jgi:hypothetical protein